MWGHETDDTKNDPWRWSTYISHCAVRWMRDPHKWTREDTDDFYDAMIETAAICAAAAESVLRRETKTDAPSTNQRQGTVNRWRRCAEAFSLALVSAALASLVLAISACGRRLFGRKALNWNFAFNPAERMMAVDAFLRGQKRRQCRRCVEGGIPLPKSRGASGHIRPCCRLSHAPFSFSINVLKPTGIGGKTHA